MGRSILLASAPAVKPGRWGMAAQGEEADEYHGTLRKLEGLLAERAKQYAVADMKVPLAKSPAAGDANLGATAAVITHRRSPRLVCCACAVLSESSDAPTRQPLEY